MREPACSAGNLGGTIHPSAIAAREGERSSCWKERRRLLNETLHPARRGGRLGRTIARPGAVLGAAVAVAAIATGCGSGSGTKADTATTNPNAAAADPTVAVELQDRLYRCKCQTY